MTAQQLALAIKQRKISSVEVMEAFLTQINKTNPEVNAIVSMQEEAALAQAKEADQKIARGEAVGPFHGLPIAIKDTHNAKGFPTTSGSLALQDNIAEQDDLVVERIKNAGAIVLGKTNVPEFAAGAHTFNEVFGTTRNPYNLNYTAGGSSGGAAAAVTSGMIPFADGSDMGGSLRFPAAFNNVVGLRPSPGRVPTYPKPALYSTLGVQGPITRNTTDAFFMMSVLSGPDNRSPLSIEEPGSRFLESFEHSISGKRVAYSTDLGGLFPVDPEVKTIFEQQIKVFEDLGCKVEMDFPDLTEAEEVFQVLRAWEFEMSYREIFNTFQNLLKPSFVWNFKKGQELSGPDIGKAEQLRNLLYHRMRTFFEKYDILLLPVSQVPPFEAELEYPPNINGTPMETYLDWMRSCYYISTVGNPALSVPGGFTKNGLPLGIQIIGPHQADFEVLQVGHAFEQATQYGEKRPTFTKVHQQ